METANRVYKELLHEVAAIWYIADEYGEKVMVKAPSNAIKSLIAGCKMDLLFGKDTNHIFPIFNAGARIFDDPVHYFRLTSVQRFSYEHKAIKRIMQLETVNIHFHNELTTCIATATLTISNEQRESVIAMLGIIEDLYTGNYNDHTSTSLDNFDYSIEKESITGNAVEIPIKIIEATLTDFIIMTNIFQGVNERNYIEMDDKNEGGVFEKQIWVALENMFLDNLYRSPKIPDKYGYRELTDVFTFHQYGSFLIETKALGVLNTNNERRMDRKVAGLQKQILKGIDQLVGAAKKVSSGIDVLDQHNNKIDFDRTMIPHCIVLVSELLPFGDWKNVEYQMMEAMASRGMYLNVLDLREFMLYIGFARGSRERFDVNLIARVEQFVKVQSIHMRVAGEVYKP